MSRFILIRHAAVEPAVSRISGRLPNIHLSEAGRRQARQLGEFLAAENMEAIYSSPRERALETAEFLARGESERIEIAAELDEIDYGRWTGAELESLKGDERWNAFNSIRSCTRIPGGELMIEAQARAAGFINRLHERFGESATLGLVTHADVIRAALAYYLAMPIDLMLRLDITPASVSIAAIDGQGPTIYCIGCVQRARP